MKPGDLVLIRDNWRPFPDNRQLMAGDVATIIRADPTHEGAYEILSSQGVFTFHFCYLEVISEAG